MNYDQQHIANTGIYAKKLGKIFEKVTSQVALMVDNPNIKFSKSFSFNSNPQLAKSAVVIFEAMKADVENVILFGISSEWALSNRKNDSLVDSYIGNLSLLKKKPDWTDHNLKALEAFSKRQINGLDLSDRVWKLVNQYQSELDIHVGLGVLNGDSADVISRRVRQYLNDPTALFRRVRNDMGELAWSKNAKAFHPGQGIYRSAYKNARRLTITETNTAYRTADHLRWYSLDFVKGFRVELSGSHPQTDICDDLKGEYPKSFLFTGWHPQCLCRAVPVLMNEKEYDYYQNEILSI